MFPLVVLAVIATASAATVEPSCSEVKVVDYFDIDAFASGVWYEIARYPISWEEHADCSKFRFYRDGDTYRFNYFEVYDNSPTTRNATGVFERANKDNAGVLNFFSPIYKESGGKNEVITRVLDADYDHYIIFYECRTLDNVQKDHIWILGRSKTMDPKAKKKLEDFFAKHKYLDINRLVWDKSAKESCKKN